MICEDFKRQQRFKQWSLELDTILKEMEDLQIKLLSLHVKAQFTRSIMEDELVSERLARDLKKPL